MYDVHHRNKFRASYRKVIRSGVFPADDFDLVLSLLVNTQRLPEVYHDHSLNGNLSGKRVCHLQGDCLLMYEVDVVHKTIYLVDIGNHANVLGM